MEKTIFALRQLEKELVTKDIVYHENKFRYYLNFNEPNKNLETVILLHPAFSDHRIFLRQFEAWRYKYNLIALDMAGHGFNNKVNSKMTIEDMPKILEMIVNQYQIKSVHIIGVSMGSLVAQAVARELGDKTKGVSIIGGYSIYRNNESILRQQKKEMGKWLFMILFSMKKFRQYLVSVSVHSDEGKYVFGLGTNCFSRRSFVPMQGMGKLMQPIDESMKFPSLLMAGEFDQPLAIETAKAWHLTEPNSELVILKDAGHCANVDNPNAFNEQLEKFIDKVK